MTVNLGDLFREFAPGGDAFIIPLMMITVATVEIVQRYANNNGAHKLSKKIGLLEHCMMYGFVGILFVQAVVKILRYIPMG